jgi:pimeloyl-ACP methyl ester carboxylesterase
MTEWPIEHRYVVANGIRFHVAECGSGPQLALCLHGFPECWYSWRYQLPALAQAGYRAWAPDLRGYGESDRPLRVSDYAIETLLADVEGLIQAAGSKKALLIGHDWGALIAWYFAMRRPEALRGLVILNVPHPGAMERALWGKQLLRSWYALFFQLPWLPERLLAAANYRAIRHAFVGMAVDKSRFPDEVLQVYRDQAARPGALTAMLNYYRALIRGGGAERQRRLGYPRIETPTLMIWGERDTALGKETTYGTDRFVSHLTLHYLPNVSHWVQQEAPETVNRLLLEWLSALDARASS